MQLTKTSPLKNCMEKKENSLRKKEKKRKETPAELISLKCACQIDDNIMKKKFDQNRLVFTSLL